MIDTQKAATIAALALFFAGAASCKKSPPQADCAQDSECLTTGEICVAGKCTHYTDCPALAQTAPCQAGQYCKERVSPSSAGCVDAGCATAGDCTGGQVCIDSACVAAPGPPAGSTCVVANSGLSAAPGATVQVAATLLDAGGKAVPYQIYAVGALSSSAAFTVSGDHALIAKSGVAAPSDETVTVTFNGGPSCIGMFRNLGDLAAGDKTRVVLQRASVDGAAAASAVSVSDVGPALFFSKSTGEYLAGSCAAAGAGVYLCPTPAGAAAFNVMVPGFNAVTIYGIAARNDFAVTLEPTAQAAGFVGQADFASYARTFTQFKDAPIGIAVAGASLPLSSLFYFSLGLFVGDTGKVALSFDKLLTPPETCHVAPTSGDGQSLPRALELIDARPIGPNCEGYAARATPGRHMAWGLATQFKDVGGLVPFASSLGVGGGSFSLAGVLKTLMPMINNVGFAGQSFAAGKDFFAPTPESDWVSFAENYGASSYDGSAAYTRLDIQPNRPLKFEADFANPGLVADPSPEGAGAGYKLDGIVSLVTAVSPAFGLVPLGFGAGFDNDGDGALDRLSSTLPANVVYTRYAAPAPEIAGDEVIGIAVATNSADLSAKAGDAKSSARRILGWVARSGAPLGWDKAAPSLGSMNDAARFVRFDGNGATYFVQGSGSAKVLMAPTLTPVGGASDADLVLLRVSAGDGATKRTWTVFINPQGLGGPLDLVLPYFMAADLPQSGAISFSTTAIKLAAAESFADVLSPAKNPDVEALAGQIRSFALYSQTMDSQ